jgi:hypothetical protein
MTYTGRLLAMVAWNPLEMNTYIGKAAFFVFIDFEVLERSRREPIPILTSSGTGVTARTSTLVEEETILRH